MPVARGPQINARSAVLVGMTGVVIALILGGMVIWVANSGDTVTIQIGDTEFDAGAVGRMSEEIDARGPVLYADAGSRGDRDLYLQHIGEDPQAGWLAFSARRVGDPRDCSVIWDPERETFDLTSSSDFVCDDVSFDQLGCGLERFPAEVIDGNVIVFLNEDPDEVAEALGSDAPDADATGDETDEATAEGPDLSCPET